MQRGRIGLLLRQGIATDQPAEIAAQPLFLQQRRDELRRFVGDHRQCDTALAQPVQAIDDTGVNAGQFMCTGVGLHEQRQRRVGLVLADAGVLVVSGQGAANQHS